MPLAASKNVPAMLGSVCDVILKIVTLFLIFIAVLAMFGRLRFPGQAKLQSMKCKSCGRYRIGKSPCQCGRK